MHVASLMVVSPPPQASEGFAAGLAAGLRRSEGLVEPFNLVVPRGHLNRGPVEALYPGSIPFQGQALNITCVSYKDQLNVGFTGSRDSVPHLQ